MTTPPGSRDSRDALSLAEVRERLREIDGLDAGKLSNLIWGLNATGRALGLPLDSIPADPRWLRDALEKCGPASCGLGEGAWANMRSRLTAALDAAGIKVMTGRRLWPLSAAWQELSRDLPTKPQRAALSRFMGFCSQEGIAPGDVTLETFESYRLSVQFTSLRSRHEAAYRDLCVNWNHCREEVAGWPDVVIEVVDRRNNYVLPASVFAPAFNADLEAMLADATGADIVNMRAKRKLASTSACSRKAVLLRLASGYIRRGGKAEELQCLRDLIEPDVVREGLRFMLERRDGEPGRGIDSTLAVVLAVARQWVRAPEWVIEELAQIRRSIDVKHYEMDEETRRMLRRFDEPAVLGRLFDAPAEIIRKAAHAQPLRVPEAVQASAALAVLMLIEAPVRIVNLTSVSLDHHLVSLADRAGCRYRLSFPPEEVKNRESLHHPLSVELSELIDLYIANIRPRLMRRTHCNLFPGAAEMPKQSSLLSKQIKALVTRRIGVSGMTAHRFRSLVGYLYLKRHPGDYETVRRFLGHRNLTTTITYYVPLQQDEANQAFESAIAEIRMDIKKARKGKR
jgi:integrase